MHAHPPDPSCTQVIPSPAPSPARLRRIPLPGAFVAEQVGQAVFDAERLEVLELAVADLVAVEGDALHADGKAPR